MVEAVIVDAVRTPGGKRNGLLSDWHPADLAAETLIALQERTGLDPGQVDDVIMGCVTQTGAQGGNVGRFAALAAGFPEHVPATTVDRQCGSSQQALHFAAQGVMAGVYDIVIAGGVEAMSMVPMGSNAEGPGEQYGSRVNARYREAGGLIGQGMAAERIAERWAISREEADAYAVRSHERALAAAREGRFQREIVPVLANDGTRVVRDEGIRAACSMEGLAMLKPAFAEDGIVTAGNSSQITDGAAAVLVMSETKASELGVSPRARFHAFAVTGVDPIMMLTGPIPATSKVLDRAGMVLDDIDLIEINEAFAPVVLAWEREHRPDMSKVNVNGGAIALGHPLGASGAKLTATLLNELERIGGRFGMLLMCEGGGMANATIIERLA